MAHKVTTATLATWRDKRLQEASPDTVILEIGLVRRALATTRDEWDIPIPVEAFGVLRKPKPDPGRIRRLTNVSADMLVDECGKSKNPALRTAVTLAFETGMRRGELVALEWAHIDSELRRLTIMDAKNGRSRQIADAAVHVMLG